jgi:SAM-dependent methyltransferase
LLQRGGCATYTRVAKEPEPDVSPGTWVSEVSVSWIDPLILKLPYRVRRVVDRRRHRAVVMKSLSGVHPRSCPICGYSGKFRAFGLPPVFDAMCGRCDSLPRHRLFVLMDQKHGLLAGVHSLLHFAPEGILRAKFRKSVADYRTADLSQARVDVHCNIEDTGLPSSTFDAVFASHILEHVNDRRAMPELHRLLKPGGKLIAMVPIVEGWDETYENPSIVSEAERELHFGQFDHVRYYGSDFGKRLVDAGFQVTTFTGTPQECVAHALLRGEKVFVATKAS